MKSFHSPLTCLRRYSVEDAIDITDMFEFGGPSLVMARRFATKNGEEIYIFDHFYVLFSC